MEKKQISRPFFVAEDGRELPVRSISILDLQSAKTGLENEYRDRGEIMDPPTYDVTLPGGVTVKHAVTEKNLEVQGNEAETARRKKEWAVYQEVQNRLDAEYGTISRDIFLDGLDVELPEDDTWIKRREKRHIEIPTDPYDRLNYYKLTEILRTPGNLVKLQSEVILLSSSGGVKRSDIEAAGDSFLRDLFDGAGEENNTKGNPEENPGKESDAVGLGTLDDNEHGPRIERVEHKTKRSRRVSPK